MDPSFGYWPIKGNSQWKSSLDDMRENFHLCENFPEIAKKQTGTPYVTGTSVLGIKYKDGVMLASDTLGSYGSMARFHLTRIHKINKKTLIAASGELSDFDYILRDLESLTKQDFCLNDGHTNSASEIYSYLTRLMYGRRSKMNPLWNHILVAGFGHDGNSFLGLVDLYGAAYLESVIATGYGSYIVLPYMRERYRPDLTEEEARKLLVDSLRVLFYRDARASDKVQVATITKEGINISETFTLDTDWSIGENASH